MSGCCGPPPPLQNSSSHQASSAAATTDPKEGRNPHESSYCPNPTLSVQILPKRLLVAGCVLAPPDLTCVDLERPHASRNKSVWRTSLGAGSRPPEPAGASAAGRHASALPPTHVTFVNRIVQKRRDTQRAGPLSAVGEVSTFSSLQPSRRPCTRRLFAQHDCLFPKHPQPALIVKTGGKKQHGDKTSGGGERRRTYRHTGGCYTGPPRCGGRGRCRRRWPETGCCTRACAGSDRRRNPRSRRTRGTSRTRRRWLWEETLV